MSKNLTNYLMVGLLSVCSFVLLDKMGFEFTVLILLNIIAARVTVYLD